MFKTFFLKPAALSNLALGLLLTLLLGSSSLALLALTGWQMEPEVELWQDPWFWQVLKFTLWQAVLSSLLSVALALPLARALVMDTSLPAKTVFLHWCLLCFVMPSLILITGLVTMFGYTGWLTPFLNLISGDNWSLYGLTGILLAHVFLNLPLAIRVLTAQWSSIPSSVWKMAAQLHLKGWQRFLLVEWPALRSVLPALSGFIFLLCFNSFAVVLALGGGPAATTLEVAVFQSLKYNFNPSEALFLAMTQFLVAGSFFWLFSRWGKLEWLAPASGGQTWRPKPGAISLWIGRISYVLIALYLTLPVLSLLPTASSQGLAGLPWSKLLKASGWSLVFALTASLLAVLMSLHLTWVASNQQQASWLTRLIPVAALHHLIIPGMVLSVGLYIFFMPLINWMNWGWLAIIWLNALIALPFAFSQLKPRVFAYQASYQRLAASLSLPSGVYWWRVVLPYLKPALQRVAAISLVLTLGDFAVFGIFGQPEYTTLPWLIYELAGSYQLAAAALASVWLLGLAFISLMLLEKK